MRPKRLANAALCCALLLGVARAQLDRGAAPADEMRPADETRVPSGDAPDGDTPADDGVPEEEVEPTTPTTEVAAPSAPPGLWSVTDHTSGSFEDRDRRRVTDEFNYWVDGSARTLQGSRGEIEARAYVNRHGFFSRIDDKFNEFVSTPLGLSDDGYGLWRLWASSGECPRELEITDPWGTVEWESAPPTGAQVRRMECSWLLRPSMYLHTGYFKVSPGPVRRRAAARHTADRAARARYPAAHPPSRAPQVTLRFREFNLINEVEVLEVYDGAGMDAPFLARYTGISVPDDITASGREVRLVYRAELKQTAAEIWEAIRSDLGAGHLQPAVNRFLTAARFRTTGFHGMDMRRLLRGLAAQMSVERGHKWMRSRWFGGNGEAFDRDFERSVMSLLQDARGWVKASRHEEGKEGVPWDDLMGPRRYPLPVNKPERNPLWTPSTAEDGEGGEEEEGSKGGGGGGDGDFQGVIQLTGSAGPRLARVAPSSLDQLMNRPSRLLLDFTTNADCSGKGMAPYGWMPPVTKSGTSLNFKALPFPLPVSSCQPLLVSGPQDARDAPFTIADAVMRTAQEVELHTCIGSSIDPAKHQIPEVGGLIATEGGQCEIFKGSETKTLSGSNCSTSCEVFEVCVKEAMQNISNWKIGPHLYNKSQAAMGRQRCLDTFEGADCARALPKPLDPETGRPTRWTRDRPKESSCVYVDCYFCGPELVDKVFDCARECDRNKTHPSTQCMDCSYNFGEVQEEIDMLRDQVWEGYFMGALGDIDCDDFDCSPSEPGMVDPKVPMSDGCRRCHYALEDFINVEQRECIQQRRRRRCTNTNRGIYNLNRDLYGELTAEAQVIEDARAALFDAAAAAEDGDGDGEEAAAGDAAPAAEGDAAPAAEGDAAADAAPAEGDAAADAA